LGRPGRRGLGPGVPALQGRAPACVSGQGGDCVGGWWVVGRSGRARSHMANRRGPWPCDSGAARPWAPGPCASDSGSQGQAWGGRRWRSGTHSTPPRDNPPAGASPPPCEACPTRARAETPVRSHQGQAGLVGEGGPGRPEPGPEGEHGQDPVVQALGKRLSQELPKEKRVVRWAQAATGRGAAPLSLGEIVASVPRRW
jgi:hypothetical protein